MLRIKGKFIVVTAAVLVAMAPLLADEIKDEDFKVDLADESEVYVEFDFSIGNLDIRPGSSEIVAHFIGEYDERDFKYDFDYNKREGFGDLIFEVSGRNHGFREMDGSDNYWRIELGSGVPMDLNIDIGAADCRFDLGGVRLKGLDLNIGAADADIRFSERNPEALSKITVDAGASSLVMTELANSNFRFLEFDGGVGSYEIDFDGQFDFEAEALISVGLGSLDIFIPGNVGVRLSADDGFFSSVDFPRREFREISDGMWESKNWDEAAGHLELDLEVGMGSIDISIGK